MAKLDYGVIGNCQVIALVDKNASIAWLCLPRFDSPSVFAHILDDDKGGHFSIRPENPNATSKQFYLRNTNILITEFTIPNEGKFEVIDFAPRFRVFDNYFKPIAIFRKIKILEGAPRVIIDCDPRLDYGLIKPQTKIENNCIDYDGLKLFTNAVLTYVLERKSFILEKDIYCVLNNGEVLEAAIGELYEDYYKKTKNYWIEWVKRTQIPFLYQDEVIRAALALKLHCYNDTGAIIASTTTSIPESPGSGRNWDYRYCWFRDAYFTIKALHDLGHYDEKERFVSYLSNIIYANLGREYLQPLYGISGEKDLIETQLEHLKGFEGNQPVRIGNDAYTHCQYDLYGEMVLCLAPIFFDRRLITYDFDKLFIDFKHLVEKSISLFGKPDAGLWEFRSEGGIHTFTQVFCWVAAYKGAEVANHLGYRDLAVQWLNKAEEMKKIILQEAWSEEKQMFTQRYNGMNADASNLLIATLGIIDPQDPKFISTVRRYGEILRKDDYVYRYVNRDDFGYPEVSFSMCTFWYIDSLIEIGELAEAKRLYDNLLLRRNHVGLLSEDIDPKTGKLWGNYPQTYSLVGIINSAIKINKAMGTTML